MSRLARLVRRARRQADDRPAVDESGFYRAGPPGDGRRGEVLAHEPIALPNGMPPDSRAWRVRYRTVDAAGWPVAASMAVAAPAAAGGGPAGVPTGGGSSGVRTGGGSSGVRTSGGSSGMPAGGGVAASMAAPAPSAASEVRSGERPAQAVVVWVHGAVGVAPGCGPSRSGLHVPYAAELIAGDLVVAAPDLTGLGVEGVVHPYLHGVTAGRAVLDAGRAASELLAVVDGSVTTAAPRIALAGHSAGGHAVLWANELASGADGVGLDLRLVVPIAPIGDLGLAMVHYATTSGHAAFPVQLVATWPGVEPVDRADVLTDAARGRVHVLAEQCLGGVMQVFRGDGRQWLRVDGLTGGAWALALAAQSPGRGRGVAPVLVLHGAADGSVLPAWSEQLVARLRSAGTEAELRMVPSADHNGVIDAARTDVAAAIVAALAR